MHQSQKLILSVLAFFVVLLVAIVAFAQEIAGPDSITSDQVPELVSSIFNAIKDKNWLVLTSAAIMLLVFVGNWLGLSRLDDYARKKYLPWISIGVAFLLQFAAALAASSSWLEAVMMAFVTGTSASGLWSMLGKQVLGKFTPPPPPPKLVK